MRLMLLRRFAVGTAAAALLAGPAHGQPAPSAWPMYHASSSHLGRSAAASLPAATQRWSRLLPDSIWGSSPVLGPGHVVYVGAMDSALYAVYTNTGAVKWKFKAGGALQYSSPAVSSDGTIYIGGMDSAFYAVDLNGALKWKFKAGSTVRSSPAIAADGTVYVGSGDQNVYAFNPGGTVKWTFPTGGNVRSSPAIGPDGTVYVGSDDGFLYALRPADGTAVWAAPLGSGVDLASPTVGPDTTIYIGATSGLFYAIRPGGTLKWVVNVKHTMYSAPAIAPGGDVVVTMGSDVWDINPVTAKINWKFVATGLIRTAPAVASDGTIYAGSADGNLYALTAAGGLKWAFATGAAVYSSPAVDTDGSVYFGGSDMRLHALGSGVVATPDSRGPARLALSMPSPNPTRDGAELRFSAPTAGRATLDVLSVDGRLVRRLFDGTLDASARTVRWDGRDASGRAVAPGIYWASLRSGSGMLTRRVAVVR